MQKITFSKQIPAALEQVWHALFGKETYPQWTEAFCAGSDIKGEWHQGEKVWFTGPKPNALFDGMYSEIAEVIPNEFLSIRHLGLIRDSQIVTDGPEIEQWQNALENYYLTANAEGTLLEVKIDINPQWIDYFEQTWPTALQRVSEIATQGFSNSVTVFNFIKAPIAKVWEFYNGPEHVTGWNFATDDWECPSAEVDLKVGGGFKSHMRAKDGSFAFDFAAKYTAVDAPKSLAYVMEDGRKAEVTFTEMDDYVKAEVRFDIENQNPREMQKQGWQAILDNFKKYCEN
jgi:uncharacterized protein YndB with AHSA1/START domain